MSRKPSESILLDQTKCLQAPWCGSEGPPFKRGYCKPCLEEVTALGWLREEKTQDWGDCTYCDQVATGPARRCARHLTTRWARRRDQARAWKRSQQQKKRGKKTRG